MALERVLRPKLVDSEVLQAVVSVLRTRLGVSAPLQRLVDSAAAEVGASVVVGVEASATQEPVPVDLELTRLQVDSARVGVVSAPRTRLEALEAGVALVVVVVGASVVEGEGALAVEVPEVLERVPRPKLVDSEVLQAVVSVLRTRLGVSAPLQRLVDSAAAGVGASVVVEVSAVEVPEVLAVVGRVDSEQLSRQAASGLLVGVALQRQVVVSAAALVRGRQAALVLPRREGLVLGVAEAAVSAAQQANRVELHRGMAWRGYPARQHRTCKCCNN